MLGLFKDFGTDIWDVADLEDMRLNFWIPSDWNEFPILFSITFELECGPIRANVRWIHYLWPPLFPLFFHRIKRRGRRRESLSIFHSNLATKILVFLPIFQFQPDKNKIFALCLQVHMKIMFCHLNCFRRFCSPNNVIHLLSRNQKSWLMQRVWIWQFIITHIENC